MKSKKSKKAKKSRKMDDVEAFIALPDSEKDRIAAEMDRQTPEQREAESRPLDAKERRIWAQFKRGLGRPKSGQGAKGIHVTVEGGLLQRADAYAKGHGLSRAQLIARGLELAIGA